MENESVPTESFGQYGQSFQQKIFQAMLADRAWSAQMQEVFNPKFFDLKYLEYLSDKYFAYGKKYKDYPSLQLLATIIKDDLKTTGTDTALREQIVDYLKKIQSNPNPADLPFVKEKTLEFCKKQALKTALEQAVDLVATSKYESIVDVVKTAVSVGTVASVGHDLFEDIEARFVSLERRVVPTGLPQLDAKDILQGGLGRGELGVVIAPTGVGKSHFLTSLGCHALRMGLNVLHYTFELSEAKTGIRYDSNLVDMDSNEVMENKEKVIEYYNTHKHGRLIIKLYPPNTATIYTLRAHVEKLALKGFRPDVVLIDYADIMRSSRQYDSLRHELKLIYEELRSYAEELGVPFWTASQSNKDGADSEVIDLSNMSEAYGKAFVADLVVSISRRAQEKSTGFGRLYIAKNRAGRDGILYPIRINTARSRFEIIGETISPEIAILENDSDMKKALAQKWKTLQKSNTEIALSKVNVPADTTKTGTD
jgi:replicative DNA helicase